MALKNIVLLASLLCLRLTAAAYELAITLCNLAVNLVSPTGQQSRRLNTGSNVSLLYPLNVDLCLMK